VTIFVTRPAGERREQPSSRLVEAESSEGGVREQSSSNVAQSAMEGENFYGDSQIAQHVDIDGALEEVDAEEASREDEAIEMAEEEAIEMAEEVGARNGEGTWSMIRGMDGSRSMASVSMASVFAATLVGLAVGHW
jgi:hypothetical protein